MNKPAKGPDPGLLYVNSKIIQPDKLSPEQYTQWYEKTHIPDIFKTAGIDEAHRWQSLDPAAERPYLAMYPLSDIGFLQTPEFKGRKLNLSILEYAEGCQQFRSRKISCLTLITYSTSRISTPDTTSSYNCTSLRLPAPVLQSVYLLKLEPSLRMCTRSAQPRHICGFHASGQ